MTHATSLQECRSLWPLPWAQLGRKRADELTEAVYGSEFLSLPLFQRPSGGFGPPLAFLETATVWQERGDSTVRNFELQVWWVKQLYDSRRPEEVFRFLQTHTFLLPLLMEAYGKIVEYFGPSPDMVLEVIADPETENDRELFAFIRTSLPPDEALGKLDRLDKEWWLDEADRAEGKLCIHVEFQ
ncbi:MAG: hypothetical protein HY731_14570 [Candidatus Tectomicrobia bacterium]|nr:hypothetical protein [Candidatus Tectomicrobia bacterium]